MSTPTANNQTPVSTTVDWVGWGLGAAGLVTFLSLFAGAFFRDWASRPRVYRTIFCGLMSAFGCLGIFSISVDGYLNQTSVIWDGTTVVSVGWIFGLLTWVNFWTMAAFFSYIPASNDMSLAFRVYKGEETLLGDGNTLLRSIDFLNGDQHYITPAALVMATTMAGGFMFFAIQQSFVMTLWKIVATGILCGVALIIASIVMTFALYRLHEIISAKVSEEEQAMRRKTLNKFVGFYWLYFFISIISYAFAFGFSPAMATDQATYTADNAVAIALVNYGISTLAIFLLCVFLDIWIPDTKDHILQKKQSKVSKAVKGN